MNTTGQCRISKLFCRIREFFPVRFLPIESAVYVNLILHTEEIAIQETFEATREFVKYFNNKTGKKPILCVTTPFCPESRLKMEKSGIDEDVYAMRVKELEPFTEIGYHGHFYHKALAGSGPTGIVPVNEKKYSHDVIKKQIGEEMEWFKQAGLNPTVYTAGWWFLTGDIVKEIDKHNFKVDCSIRRNLDTNTFGGRYLKKEDLPPVGVNFLLPPSKKIIEIQSLFGFAVANYRLKPLLKRFLDFNVSQDIFLVFYFHDYDIPKYHSALKKNIHAFSNIPFIKWEDVRKMLELHNLKKSIASS